MRLTSKLLGVSCGFLLAAAAGCGGDTTNNGTDCTASGAVSGMTYRYATSALKLPSSAAGYSIDVDGGGKPQNQLKAIVSAVTAAGLSLDDQIAKAVMNGDAVILTQAQAADLTSGCAKATLSLAAPPAMGDPLPKYDGSDNFKLLSGQTATSLYGNITGSKLDTIRPSKQTGDQVQHIQIALPLSAGANLPLTIYGAHIQGTLTADKITNGELHGVIRKKDIDGQIIPAVAMLLTDMIHKDPMGSTTMTIIHLFEDMTVQATKDKCKVDKDCCSKSPTTCKILPEEVANNPLIGNVLSPDVQMFAADGTTWQPTPKGTMKDSLSVGIGFTSVKASFAAQ